MNEIQKIKEKTALNLLKIKAVFLNPQNPFTWASGIKSPIYCDNRLILGYPEIREEIEKDLSKLIKYHYPEADCIMGTATAGIPHASFAAANLKLPMGYVRSSSKDHGRKNQIEGMQVKDLKIVVVEDLISTGGSSMEVIKILREAGGNIMGTVSIFSYGMQKSKDNFIAAGTEYHSLSDIDTLTEIAVREKYITKEDRIKILKFRDNPQDQSWETL